MRAAILFLDDALAGQPDLRRRAEAAGGREIDAGDLGPALRLWARWPALRALAGRVRNQLPAKLGPQLVFAGSGDFHHATPTLLARALEVAGDTTTVLHFDNHPDWVRYANGLHCGSWVGEAARMRDVTRMITVGVCSSDIGHTRQRSGDLSLVTEGRLTLFAYRAPDGGETLDVSGSASPTIESLGPELFIERLLAAITTRNVYVTIDKDVLRHEDAATNWDQGRMSLDEVVNILRAVMTRHRIIGADVVGDWSRPIYGGGLIASALKRGEALLDQPWRAPADAANRNQSANLRLLDLFAEAA